MSKKKYQTQDDKDDEEQAHPSEMILPKDNIFNIDTQVKKQKKEPITEDSPASMQNHHKFSKFKK